MPLSGAAPGEEEPPEERAPEEDMPEEALLEAGPPELSSGLTSGFKEMRYGWGEKVADFINDEHPVPFPVSWTVKMKKKQKETQDILSYHTQAAGCSDKARAKASGGRQPIEECGRTGL